MMDQLLVQAEKFKAKIEAPKGPVAAYNRCWIFGDEFGSHSFEQHFQARKCTDYNCYTKAHFDTVGFFNNFTLDNPSVLGRLSSLLQYALERKDSVVKKLLLLPKLIVVVPEDALIRVLDCREDDHNVSGSMSRLINYIMTEFKRCVASFKENLPAKCVKSEFPYFLWIQPPQHKNFSGGALRFKFNRCLEEVAKMHLNVYTLALKKVWDKDDDNLFLENQRFSNEGYRAYWEAIDKTIYYFDSVILKKIEKKTQKNGRGTAQKEQFCWQNPKFNRDSSYNKVWSSKIHFN